jgi:hypothetical protein
MNVSGFPYKQIVVIQDSMTLSVTKIFEAALQVLQTVTSGVCALSVKIGYRLGLLNGP